MTAFKKLSQTDLFLKVVTKWWHLTLSLLLKWQHWKCCLSQLTFQKDWSNSLCGVRWVCTEFPRVSALLPQHTNTSNHGQRQQQANAWNGAYPRGFHPLGKGNPEQERTQYRVWRNGGQGFPWVLWHNCYCCVKDLGTLVPAGYGPDWRNGKTPSLVPLLYEGIPKARCHVHCGWWFGGCHRPQNSPKIHLAIH